MPLVPSVRVPGPPMLTVVVSTVSTMLVTAGVGSTDSAMPPPEVPVMVALTLVGSTYTSSLAATGTVTLPVRAPALMWIVWPFDRVTSSAVTGACVSVAV